MAKTQIQTQSTHSVSNAVVRNLDDKLSDFINVKDFGTYGTSAATDTANLQKALNAAGSAEKNLFVPAGTYLISDTLFIPAGVRVIGEGKYDYYDSSSRVNGTLFKTNGNGLSSKKKWTDITGSDAADDTPMFVALGNGVYLENVTLLRDATTITLDNPETYWTIGILYPCVKQCGFSGLQAFDFTDAAVYLDATWSNLNIFQTGLVPDGMTLEPNTGMNEFIGRDFLLNSKSDSTGFGIKIQGSTRNPDSFNAQDASSNPWIYGWGGASDVVFENGRVSNISVDGALKNAAKALQGIRFVNVDIRAGSRPTMLNLDRANRIEFVGGYGEASSTTLVKLTSNTGKISFFGGRYTDTNIAFNGSALGISLDSNASSFENISTNSNIRDILSIFDYDGNLANRAISWRGSTISSSSINFEEGGKLDDLTTGNLIIDGNTGHTGIRFMASHWRPRDAGADINNHVALGHGDFRFSLLYAGTATNVSSDRNLKQDIADLTAAEKKVAVACKGLLKKFRFKDAVATKGDAARIHFGIIAQDLEDAFKAEGLDASRYGMFCSDTWTDEQTGQQITRLGVRYSELLAFVISSI